MNGKPPVPPGGGVGKNTVVAPKTRIAVGVVFIGALIYSMVGNTYNSRTNGKVG
jgi:coproporphyrinogen III oxidase